MTVTTDNSYDSSPIGCTFPLLCCNKNDFLGKGKTENSWNLGRFLSASRGGKVQIHAQ